MIPDEDCLGVKEREMLREVYGDSAVAEVAHHIALDKYRFRILEHK